MDEEEEEEGKEEGEEQEEEEEEEGEQQRMVQGAAQFGRSCGVAGYTVGQVAT
jgi:hypothetical protein